MENAPEYFRPAAASVLVVDDHPNTADMLARAIRTIDLNEPVDVYTAITGEEALAHSRDRTVEVLIVDYMMPGMNGLDLIDALRSADRLPGHIILISAYTVPDSELDDRAIKIDARFSKPVKTEKILHTVRGMLTEPESLPTDGATNDFPAESRPNGGPPGEKSDPAVEETSA
ncbi:MAG TPA: response regulator [Anaerolineales bacterium]|nr:response regulator [Anaerolineales bacterium]